MAELDQELKLQFDEASEINTYFLIQEIGSHVLNMNSLYKRGRITEEKFNKIREGFPRLDIAQDYGISQLYRFGVTPSQDEQKRPTPEYWAWYHWWDRYIKNLPNDKWKELELRIYNKEDLSKFRPLGTWKADVETQRKYRIDAQTRLNEVKNSPQAPLNL